MESVTSSSSSSSPSKSTMASSKLKLAGTCSGFLELELSLWTVPMLREEIAKRSNSIPQSIKLICGGKVLKDGDETLECLGVRNNAKILATRTVATDPSMMAEEERSSRLTRIKHKLLLLTILAVSVICSRNVCNCKTVMRLPYRNAAVALAARHTDGSLPVEDFNLEVEDQSGQKVQLGSETDRRGVMMGLMLHTNAKHLIKKHKYKDALDVLAMGEESFSLCDPRVLAMIDNVLHLQIDMVWCYFMLRDITCLSMAGVRLEKARSAVERSRRDSGTWPVMSLRLDLLEGVVAYHSSRFHDSLKALLSAQTNLNKLQVRDEDLSMLISMGFKEREVKMALRKSDQQADVAVDFLVQEREKKAQRREEDIQRRKDIMDQKLYGVTPLKKSVDLQRLVELVSTGFEKELAAEALRRNENDTEMAIIDLTNPIMSTSMQMVINSRNKRRRQDRAIEQLTLLGFERAKVITAVRATNTQEEALRLLTEPLPDSSVVTNNGNVASTVPVHNNVDSTSSNSVPGGPSVTNETEEERDVEMEDEIAQDLTGDPFADCDFDLTKEGEAITEYLALLKSMGHDLDN
ncbi:hypothetical protein GIB67_014836 [Kingdonia uniflora]|uniref:Uncharacterized protein n=1 Tax=Kingdonia uniflora TaxID=39325 RepID=A0A7J7MTB1_9MAGN|nr:hypothetical protein GIB67_014836 [Kingdonia uniflora]